MSTGVIPVSEEQFKIDFVSANINPYYIRVLIALDVFLNVTFFNGRLDESMSSHAARSAARGNEFAILACKFLNLFQRNHGANAEVSDYSRAVAIAKTEEAAGEFPKGE